MRSTQLFTVPVPVPILPTFHPTVTSTGFPTLKEGAVTSKTLKSA